MKSANAFDRARIRAHGNPKSVKNSKSPDDVRAFGKLADYDTQKLQKGPITRPLRAAPPAAPNPRGPSAALPRSCARPPPRSRRHRRVRPPTRSRVRYQVQARPPRRISAANEPVL